MKRPGIDFPWIQLISDIRGLKFQEVFRIAMTPAVRSCSVCSNYFTLPAGVCTRIASPFADLFTCRSNLPTIPNIPFASDHI